MVQIETLPNEIILHILHFIDDNECFHSTCFAKKNWLLNIWPYRKEKLSFNACSDLDRYLQNVNSITSAGKVSSAKNSTIGSVVGAINASSRATHIEEKKIGTRILFDYFDRFTNLKEVSLVNCGLNDSTLEKLCSINRRGLITLNISKNKNITWNNTQKCIMLCENIKDLDISYNFQTSTPNQNTQNTWIDTLSLPMSLERLNVSGFLSEVPDFESLFRLIKRFSDSNQETEHPIIKVFLANHLTEFSLLKPEYLRNLRQASKKTLIEMYHHCFVFLKSLTFVEIYTALGFYPASELINQCILKGHTRSLELLASIDFPFNTISLGVLEEAILAGHSSIISKLRVLGFTRFDDIADDLLDKLVTRGDAAAITELRSCNVPRRKWDLISLSSVETAVRNGNKDVLEHIRMLNLGDLLKQVAIEHVEYALERGHSGILKQLTSSDYQYLNDINPQILANTVSKSVTFEIVLRNAGYKHLTEIKSLIKQQTNTKPEKKSKKEKKKAFSNFIGKPISSLPTPCLLIDEIVYHENLRNLKEFVNGKVAIRPHFKAHKTPNIAADQIKAGGCGVCCQKISEAIEALSTVDDVLISNQVVSLDKLKLLIKMNNLPTKTISLCVDNCNVVKLLDRLVMEEQQANMATKLNLVVEYNVGQNRCGAETHEQVLELIKSIQESSHLNFKGIQCYNGANQHIRAYEERKEATLKVVEKTKSLIDYLEDNGIKIEYLTGGGTGTFEFEMNSGIFTEIQPGSWLFGDLDYGSIMTKNNKPILDDPSHFYSQSLYILTTVVSKTTDKRIVVDAGLKASSLDSGSPILKDPQMRIVQYKFGGDEHGILEVNENEKSKQLINQFNVGDQIQLIPGHVDPTFNMYDNVIFFNRESNLVTRVENIKARGPGI